MHRKSLPSALFAFFATLLIFIPAPLPAPIFGFFPGFDFLDRESNHVVVAIVLEEIPLGYDTMGLANDYRIGVVKSLKGSLAENETPIAALRFLTRIPEPDRKDAPIVYRPWTPPVYANRLYVIFLKDGKAWTSPQVELQSNIYSANYEGGVIEISPDTDLSVVDGLPAAQAVPALIRASIKAKKARVASEEKFFDDWLNPKPAN